jgi:hypothetical protein
MAGLEMDRENVRYGGKIKTKNESSDEGGGYDGGDMMAGI